jgi:hypothetical protein
MMPERFELATAERVEIGRYDPTRPANSPGSGMVQCVKTGDLRSPDGKESVRVTAGRTRCAPGYWAVTTFPEYFKPCDRRDTRTYHAHRDNLARARQDLERGLTRTRSSRSSSGRKAFQPLGPRRPRTEQPWRLPRPSAATRVLP